MNLEPLAFETDAQLSYDELPGLPWNLSYASGGTEEDWPIYKSEVSRVCRPPNNARRLLLMPLIGFSFTTLHDFEEDGNTF